MLMFALRTPIVIAEDRPWAPVLLGVQRAQGSGQLPVPRRLGPILFVRILAVGMAAVACRQLAIAAPLRLLCGPMGSSTEGPSGRGRTPHPVISAHPPTRASRPHRKLLQRPQWPRSHDHRQRQHRHGRHHQQRRHDHHFIVITIDMTPGPDRMIR